jgi:hypothetical protein
MARPKKDIDADKIMRMARILCTTEEIAAVLNCSPDTIERRFAGVIQKGRERGRQSLRRKQYQLAMKGDRTMLVWLGKQYLGQRDRHEHTGADGEAMRIEVIYKGDGHTNGNGRISYAHRAN